MGIIEKIQIKLIKILMFMYIRFGLVRLVSNVRTRTQKVMKVSQFVAVAKVWEVTYWSTILAYIGYWVFTKEIIPQ